jgi:deoxycytidine triphosphate deaminase
MPGHSAAVHPRLIETQAMSGQTQGLLNADQILERFEAGSIFRPGTWTPDSLRPGGYDLRIASDRMVVPPRAGEEPTLVYPEGRHRTEPVRLAPGDSALVSSAERLAMPADLAGNIGGKFIQSTRGLLVLTGFMLDPGYGMVSTDRGLEPTEDARLHSCSPVSATIPSSCR